jgi:DNA-binding NtrC family response regulator
MSIHVVHVEDDKPLKDILRALFQAAYPNINLHQFTSGDEVIPYIQENLAAIDLFVLDIRLPGSLTGIQIAEKICELKCSGHIILTSAYSRPKLELLKRLKCEYFPKPWHLMDIAQKLYEYQRQDPFHPTAPPPTPWRGT